MALGDIHSLIMSGTYCGVPVSMSMAYLQIADDAQGETAGERLVRLWFDETIANGGPWHTIRLRLTTDLEWECVVDQYGQTTETFFLTDATGQKAPPSLPTAMAAQINIPARFPHANKGEGRFYLPGVSVDDQERSSFSQDMITALEDFCLALQEIDDLGAGQGPRYTLIPHADYRNEAGGDDGIDAFVPYPSPFIKVIGSRRSDACQAFVGGGGAGFAPIVVTPPEP